MSLMVTSVSWQLTWRPRSWCSISMAAWCTTTSVSSLSSSPPYTISIHKSQGSEYPAVVIRLLTQHYPMLRRNLVYTGITRGKGLVVLVGQRKALTIAVRDSRAERRWSKLNQWLRAKSRSRREQALLFRLG